MATIEYFTRRTCIRNLVGALTFAIPAMSTPAAENASQRRYTGTNRTKTTGEGRAILWREPVDIAERNLYYGPGGKAHEPAGMFMFEEEDMDGSNPKFVVKDQEGIRWTVKMGSEARPETAASRLLWAVGYAANENYFLPLLRVANLPHLHRGGNEVLNGTVRNVRLKRHNRDQQKIGTWSWSNNPFANTRELYGLRVFMAVINNWDLKDSNNAIYQVRGDDPRLLYVVSDLGSSFGSSGLNWHAKGDLKAYSHSKFITQISAEFVDFGVPAAPKPNTFINFPELVRRLDLRWLGQRIPTADARWMGDLLGRLSAEQIRDAFRAAGYLPEEIGAYTSIIEERIVELKRL